MARWDYIPESEHRANQAYKLKRKADELAFPRLAQRLIDMNPPPEEPQEPPNLPQPDQGGLPPAPPGPSFGYTPQGDIPSQTPVSSNFQSPTASAPEVPDFLKSMGQGLGADWQSYVDRGRLTPRPVVAQQGEPSWEASPAGQEMRAAPPSAGDLAGQFLGDVGGALDYIGPGPFSAGVGVLAGIKSVGNVARRGAPALRDVVPAAEAVIDFKPLEEYMQQASKGMRQLNISQAVRLRQGGPLRTDAVDALTDAVRRQRGHIEDTVGGMATAVRAKWQQLGQPFIVQDGLVKNGPAQGKAFQDVMSWSEEEARVLPRAQQDFLNYFHTLQDGLVKAIEDRGVKISKLDLADGRRYLHRVYTQIEDYKNNIGAKVGTGATQSFQMGRTHETVQELLDAGRVKTLDDPAVLFQTYAQELLKKAADADLINFLKPLGQTVRERVGEEVIDLAIQAARQRKAAGNLLAVVKQVASGGSPAGATLKSIRDNFPEIGQQLDSAMAIKPKDFMSTLDSFSKEVWQRLGTSKDAFRSALAQVSGGETATVLRKPVTYSDLTETLSLLRADEKTSLSMLEQIYKNSYSLNKAERGAALKDVLVAAQEQLGQTAEMARRTKNAYTSAIGQAGKVYPGEGTLGFLSARNTGVSTAGPSGRAQQLAKIIFPREMEVPKIGPEGQAGSQVISGQDFAGRLNKILGPQGENWLAAHLAPIKELNALVKAGQVVLDIGGPLIQGFPVLFSNPVKWGKAAGLSYRAFVQPEIRDAWLSRPENYKAMKSFIENGGKLGSSDFTEALQSGGTVSKIGQFVRENVPGGQLIDRIPIHPGKAFVTFSDIARVSAYKDLQEYAVSKGAATEVADFVSKLTGGRSAYGPITHSGQRALHQIAAYAADYTRASLALATDAFKPGIEGALARPALVKMAASYPATLYMVALGVDSYNGKPHYTDPDNPDFIFNPNGRYFLRVPIEGDVMSFAGFWPALLRTTVKSVAAVTGGDPGKFAQVWGGFAVSRIGPVGGILKEQIQGETFTGEPLNTWGKRAGALASSVLPFTAQAGLEGAGPAALIGQFSGLGTSLKSPSAKRDELLNSLSYERFGVPWEKSSMKQRQELNADPRMAQAELEAKQARFENPLESMSLKDVSESSTAIRQALPQDVQKEMKRLGQTVRGLNRSVQVEGQKYYLEDRAYREYKQAATVAIPKLLSNVVASKMFTGIDDKGKGQMIEDAQSISHEYLAALIKNDKPLADLPLEDISIAIQVKAYERTLPRWTGYNQEQQKTIEAYMKEMRRRMDKMPAAYENKQARALAQMAEIADKSQLAVINAIRSIAASDGRLDNPEIKRIRKDYPQVNKYYGEIEEEDLLDTP